MEVKEIMASMQGCFQSLSLVALLKHRECLMAMGGIDSQVAVLAVQTLVASHEFMASCVNDEGPDASTMLQAFAALLQIAMTPDWCSSKFKPFPKVDENEIWAEIELFATHLLTKLRPSLVVLQFGNVTGKLQPEDYEENMKNILDSLEKALRMPCLTSLSQHWEVPNNSLDCSLVAALICDSGKLTSILQRSLLAPLQLQVLAGAPDRRRALILLSQRFDFMMDSVLQGKYHGLKGNQGILQNIKLALELRSGPVELDTVRHILYDVLGHCSCSQQANRDCDCPEPQFISWTVDVRDEFYSIWCWGNVFQGLASCQKKWCHYRWCHCGDSTKHLAGLSRALSCAEHCVDLSAPRTDWLDNALGKLSSFDDAFPTCSKFNKFSSSSLVFQQFFDDVTFQISLYRLDGVCGYAEFECSFWAASHWTTEEGCKRLTRASCASALCCWSTSSNTLVLMIPWIFG